MPTPSLREFTALARSHNLIPVRREVLADCATPVSTFRRIAGNGPSFLMESVEGGEQVARYTFLGTAPRKIVESRGDRITHRAPGGEVLRTFRHPDPLAAMREEISGIRAAKPPGLPPFSGGYVGYLGYDAARRYETLPDRHAAAAPEDDIPDSMFLLADTVLAFDQARHVIQIIVNAHVPDPSAAQNAWEEASSRIAAIEETLERPEAPGGWGASPASKAPFPDVASNMDKAEYIKAVRRAKAHIADGEIIQVVPSQRFRVNLTVHPFAFYRALRVVNPSPYMYYLDLGNLVIAGASPEMMTRTTGDEVETRPIAGTRPRGATPAEDRELAQDLLGDEKERAEHVMLVDLARNDIGRVARFGDVQVEDFMTIERYSHVMHIVSRVRGRLRPEHDAYDALRATFPAGTLSGAPKIRAMEIIDELEAERRGVYGGAVGYFSYSGDSDTAIAIRTLVARDGIGAFQAGGGVVADSDPEAEYDESRNKAGAVLAALRMAHDRDFR